MTALTDREMAVELAVMVIVSAAILLGSGNLAFMTGVVGSVMVARSCLRYALGVDRGRFVREWIWLAACVLVGGGNDWNTVVNHGVYTYTVPGGWGAEDAIPVWMLLYWGLILRFMISLFRWRRLDPDPKWSDGVRLGWGSIRSARVKIAVQLGLVMATRQAIYHLYGDPLWSWLPFAVALVVYFALFGSSRAERRLVAAIAVVGPVVEATYIGVGHLHRYELGVVMGVPIWIALWWVLGTLVLRDLSLRIWAVAGDSSLRAT